MDKKQEFLKRILATFRIEAEENLETISAELIELEKDPPELRKKELVEVIFRAAHSLKGASRAVNLSEIESICHAFEDVMSEVRSGELTLNSQAFDILHQTVDLLTELLKIQGEEISIEMNDRISEQIEALTMVEAGLATGESGKAVVPDFVPEPAAKPEPKPEIIEKAKDERKPTVDKAVKAGDKPSKKKTSEASAPQKRIYTKKASDETIRISTHKLDNLLFQAEEMLALKLSAIQRTDNLQNILQKLTVWNNESSTIFSSTRSIKQFLDTTDKEKNFSNKEKEIKKVIQFYEWGNSHIKNIEKELNDLRNFSNQEIYSSGAKIESLLDDVKDLITVPFATLLHVFPKMVRDISKDLEKEVDLVIEGDDVEIDRRILEKMRNPLIHILRNSLDYGIEKPEIRKKKNKSLKGSIKLKIERLDNNKVEILISDDGAGVNLEKLKQLYIQNEKISELDIEKIKDIDCLNYMFSSGISTNNIITDLSGRGLGLAIVQEAIEHLGGTINVETEKGKSTTFRIHLPLSIVTFRGVLLELLGSEFIVPTSKVQRFLRINKKEIKTIENKATIPLDGEIIPLINLSNILGLPLKENTSEYVRVIVFIINGKNIGFMIDKVYGEQEVLVKNFNKQLTHVKNISGATILGSGKVVPILNISDLFKSSLKNTVSNTVSTVDTKHEKDSQKSILVVEDSITSRTLLKNILEASGYLVTTAIDGVEGFTKLKEGSFDAVVSDIEMPRMNGFDLTAKIRTDRDASNIPVVLVTSLSKREDKERGIDVGANAYIIKSSFDQSNLLEILDRLI